MAEIAFGIAETILVKLGSKVYEEFGLAKSVKDDLRKLEETAANLKSVLEDAEKKQSNNDADALRRWLIRLKDVFEDALDVLDEFECEALRRQVVSEFGSFGRKVRRFFSRSNPLAFRLRIAHNVKEIKERLEELVKEMAQFQLIRAQLNGRDELQGHASREMTHSFVNASEVIGRDSEKKEILDLLISDDSENDDVSDVTIIPIVGLGGLGKTTLAKSVYNDERVVDRFDLRLWACLPLDFNFTESVREILKSAISATDSKDVEHFTIDKALNRTRNIDNLSIDQMQMLLRSILKDKRLLLVLDDVWNEDCIKWNEIKDLLLTVCGKRSKIIVTTRSTAIASVMGTIPMHNLASLSEEDSLSLFLKYAFGSEQSAERFPKLKEIGWQIVKKCKGVPLALKSLGSLLCSKTDENEWTFVRDSEIWELEHKYNDPILSALRLSYITMPPILKQCFVYCSLFPKNVRVVNIDMIAKWMALGVLQSTKERMSMEDFGQLCFKELCARSFFQYLDDPKDNFKVYQEFEMHDLIQDLALSIIQNEHCTVNSLTTSIPGNTRYLTIFFKGGEWQRVSRELEKCSKVLCVSFRSETVEESINIDESFLSTCITSFRRVRILDFENSSFETLPNSIGDLKHLRYLSLSDNKRIKKLPNSICKLQSLQTLGLDGCEELEELPRDMKKLISLRILTLTTKQMYLPENGIGRLKSLRTLGIVSCKNLRSLPPDMRHCTSLRTLLISTCDQLELASEGDECITPLSLQTFMVYSLHQTTALPNWLQGAANTLSQLLIAECPILATLPEWLPKLASLKTLFIRECPKLSSFPEEMRRLVSLTSLKIGSCPALEERCSPETGEDWPKIAHIPNVNIGDVSMDLTVEHDDEA